MADELPKGYIRLNHFHGLRLESADFEVGEKYHIDKRKLHNKVLHGRGVVPRYSEQFRVVARRRGDLSVDVNPGYAIDGEGNDIILWEPKIVTIDPGKVVKKMPGHAFIVAKYVDEPVDFVVNQANPKFRGHRRALETSRIDIDAKVPEPEAGIELARVLFTDEVKEITDAKDPENPGPGEIDLRFVPKAGVAGSMLDADLNQRLKTIFKGMWDSLGSLAKIPLNAARDMRGAVGSLQMLMEAGNLDSPDVLKGVQLVIDLGDEMGEEVDKNVPELNSVREYGQWKDTLEALRGITREAKPNRKDLENVINRLGGAAENLKLASDVKIETAPPPTKAGPGKAAAAEEAPVEEAPKEAPKPAKAADAVEVSWQDLQKLSKLPKRIYMDGKNFDLVDEIQLLDKKSEADHDFAILEAKQDWTTNQTFKYPDKVSVTARGRAHVGGLSKWKMKNMKPGKDVIIGKRIDFVRGDIVTRMEVDGKTVGDWKIDDSDRVYRWRNWLFKVPGDAIAKAEVECKQVAVEAERDINMFGLWFYQAVD